MYVSVSGWGQWGPDHDRVGYDPMAQAAGGFISLNGEVNGPPVKAPTFLCDDLAGLHGARSAGLAYHQEGGTYIVGTAKRSRRAGPEPSRSRRNRRCTWPGGVLCVLGFIAHRARRAAAPLAAGRDSR